MHSGCRKKGVSCFVGHKNEGSVLENELVSIQHASYTCCCFPKTLAVFKMVGDCGTERIQKPKDDLKAK